MAEAQRIEVQTGSGPVCGAERGETLAFYGIPFAAPPVGSLRWRAPQPHAPWPGMFRAERYGPAAVQRAAEVELANDPAVSEFSEDCLSLNIYTPAQRADGKGGKGWPVMVWIHGGGFAQGAGSGGIYRSTSLVERHKVVLVTVNYRLGPLGFLRLEGLTGGAIPSTGNEGLLDQVAALRWVQANIAAFGGDPARVTVFGESAGGMSVAALMAMDAAKGLFRAAICQSGSGEIAAGAEDADEMARELVGALLGQDFGGLEGEELGRKLQEIPAEDILDAQAQSGWPQGVSPALRLVGMKSVPVVDGQVLARPVLEALAAGSAAQVDLTAGYNADEWNFFCAFDAKVWGQDAEAARANAARWLPGGTDAAGLLAAHERQLQARGRPTHPGALYSQVAGDHVFRLPTLRLLDAQRRGGGAARGYRFCWPSPLAEGVLGACHALELPFVFGSRGARALGAFCGLGEQADALELDMQRLWAEIAQAESGGAQPGLADGQNWAQWPDGGAGARLADLGANAEGAAPASRLVDLAAPDGVEDDSLAAWGR